MPRSLSSTNQCWPLLRSSTRGAFFFHLARAWSFSMLSFSWTLLLVVALPPSDVAALPAPPIVEDVPAGPVEVPPRPSVDAEVPPAAALPAEPTVPLPWLAEPAPTVDAL